MKKTIPDGFSWREAQDAEYSIPLLIFSVDLGYQSREELMGLFLDANGNVESWVRGEAEKEEPQKGRYWRYLLEMDSTIELDESIEERRPDGSHVAIETRDGKTILRIKEMTFERLCQASRKKAEEILLLL